MNLPPAPDRVNAGGSRKCAERPGVDSGRELSIRLFSMNIRSDSSPLVSHRRHPCGGPVWVVDFDGRGVAGAAFCGVRSARIGPPGEVAPAEVLLGRLARDLQRFRRRRSLRWVWLSPSADPFVPAAPDLAGPALTLATELLREGIGVVVRTRGGLGEARGLLTIARRHPRMLRVEIGAFSADPTMEETWEHGTAPLGSRLRLARSLVESGADVVARVGPILPLVNDGEEDFRRLLRDLARHGIHTVVPEWIEDSLGLVKQVEREVSKSRARMLEGWFRMDRMAPAGSRPVEDGGFADPHVPVRRRLPERVRKHVLSRLEAAAAQSHIEVVHCACTSDWSEASCLLPPSGLADDRQLDLFAETA